MNDQLTGQLVLNWAIPEYARDMLWVEGEGGAARAEGVKGLFTLPTVTSEVTIRWGSADGPALARLPWRADSLEWDGAVRIGGFIDAMHIAASGDADSALVVLQVGGQPLKPDAAPFTAGSRRGAVPYPVPGFFDGVDDSVEETYTTWIATDDSPVLTLAQDALVSKMRVWCFGRLTAEKARWHERFALPIWLSEMTMFST